MKILRTTITLGLVSLSSFAFGSELKLRIQENGPTVKLICSGPRSEEAIEYAKNQIQNRLVEGFNFTDKMQLQLVLKDGSVIDLENDGGSCFIGQ